MSEPTLATVLVAEDDLQIASLIAMALTRKGYAVLHAPDGARALDLAAEHRPDLILLDLMMPVTTGLEVLAKLREEEAGRKIPVLILSARSRPSDVRLGLSAGAVGYLTKPFSLSHLLERIERALPATR